MLFECTLKRSKRGNEEEERNGTYPLPPRREKSGSRDQAQHLAPHMAGASVLNFDQRDIVKTSRNSVFSLVFPLLLCDNRTLLSVVALPPPAPNCLLS